MTPVFARQGAVTVIDVGQELSLRSGGDLKEALAARLRGGERQFVLDFANTGFIDSAGLGALISMSRLVHSFDGTMRLTALNDDMRRLFELTKLDTLFDVVPSPAGEPEIPDMGESDPRGLELPGQRA